jgi:hypothetical protein
MKALNKRAGSRTRATEAKDEENLQQQDEISLNEQRVDPEASATFVDVSSEIVDDEGKESEEQRAEAPRPPEKVSTVQVGRYSSPATKLGMVVQDLFLRYPGISMTEALEYVKMERAVEASAAQWSELLRVAHVVDQPRDV